MPQEVENIKLFLCANIRNKRDIANVGLPNLFPRKTNTLLFKAFPEEIKNNITAETQPKSSFALTHGMTNVAADYIEYTSSARTKLWKDATKPPTYKFSVTAS